MKTTTVALGSHFDVFVQASILGGRYTNASEVIRAGLRRLEEDEQKIAALRAAIEEGEASGYVEDFDFESHLEELPQPTPQPAPQPTPQPVQAAPQPGSTITLGQDGKYHWYYEVKMLKNTAILGTLLKVFGGVVAGMWLFANAMNGFEDVGPTTKVMLIILGVIVVLTLLGYLLVAAMYGGKYCVLFEMDEKGVSHTQLPKQFKKAQVMGLVSAFAGGSPGTVAPGLLAATRNSLYSDFRSVRTIKPKPGQHLIKVNAPMSKNQIYVEDQDFQFVLDFIRSHCPKACG